MINGLFPPGVVSAARTDDVPLDTLFEDELAVVRHAVPRDVPNTLPSGGLRVSVWPNWGTSLCLSWRRNLAAGRRAGPTATSEL